jgi:hypothetical protein
MAKECPDCDGEGYVCETCESCGQDSEHECSTCQGLGEVDDGVDEDSDI